MIETLFLSALITGFAPTHTTVGEPINDATLFVYLYSESNELIETQRIRPGQFFEFVPPAYGTYKVVTQRMRFTWSVSVDWVTYNPNYVCGNCHQ